MHDDSSHAATQEQASDNLARLAADDDPLRGLGAVRAHPERRERLAGVFTEKDLQILSVFANQAAVQVANARRAGWSWQQIADVLRVSRQAVHQKHAHESRPRRPEGEDEQ